MKRFISVRRAPARPIRLSALQRLLALSTLCVAAIITGSNHPHACAAEGQFSTRQEGQFSARQGAYISDSRWGRENLAKQSVEQIQQQQEQPNQAAAQQIPQRWASHVPASRWGQPAGSTSTPQVTIPGLSHFPGTAVRQAPPAPGARPATTDVRMGTPSQLFSVLGLGQPTQATINDTTINDTAADNTAIDNVAPLAASHQRVLMEARQQAPAAPVADTQAAKANLARALAQTIRTQQQAPQAEGQSPSSRRPPRVKLIDFHQPDALTNSFPDDVGTVSTAGPFEVIDHTGELQVVVRRSKLLRSETDIYRTAVVDPSVCDIVQFTPREISIIGKSQGATHITFWFDQADNRPLTYLVRVMPDPNAREELEVEYDILEEILAELFPDSDVELIPVADKLIVKGEAQDAEEAVQIMHIIRGEVASQVGGRGGQGGFGLGGGRAANVLSNEETGRNEDDSGIQVVNLLRVPGAHQVALRVKIAELNRTAARGFGMDLDAEINFSGTSRLFVRSMLNLAAGDAPTIIGQVDGDDITFGLRYLQQYGVVRLLSEPTLVTLSGRPATFIAGGEFAVPTVVGTGGVNAVTTDFRSFGAIISFLPVVLDKDRIRLEVSPEFSQLNAANAVGGIPGLDVRAVTTTVEMREGQTLAIAGLLSDSMTGSHSSDVPFLQQWIGRRDNSRAETELIILVTPELVEPMEPEEVPPLPGFDVTEPDNMEFYREGWLEGTPTREYRSTIWPHLRHRFKAGGPAHISGPFGHGQ